MLALALVKGIEILGEATYQISQQTREQFPNIPWEDFIGLRHRLVHAYFDINLGILWKTVEAHLPQLIEMLNGQLEKSNDAGWPPAIRQTQKPPGPVA